MLAVELSNKRLIKLQATWLGFGEKRNIPRRCDIQRHQSSQNLRCLYGLPQTRAIQSHQSSHNLCSPRCLPRKCAIRQSFQSPHSLRFLRSFLGTIMKLKKIHHRLVQKIKTRKVADLIQVHVFRESEVDIQDQTFQPLPNLPRR